MLSKSIINIVAGAASAFSDKGITIMPNGDHELASLNKAAMAVKESAVHDLSSLTSFVDSIPQTSNNEEHHRLLISFSDEVARLASIHIAHCNDVVGPMTNSFAKDLSEFQNVKLVEDDPSKLFDIVPFKLPEIVSFSLFEDLLKEPAQSVQPERHFPVKPMTPEEVLAFLTFPEAKLNKSIHEWFVNSNGYVQYVYDCIFGAGTPKGKEGIDLRTIGNHSTIEQLHIGILFTLMGTMYQAKLPDTTEGSAGLTLAKWSALCKDYVAYGTSIVRRCLSMFSNMVTVKRVIINIEKRNNGAEGTVVNVFAPMYDAWLESGGSPEILFGSAIDNMPSHTHDKLLVHADKFRQNWASYSTISSARFRKSRNSRILAYIEQQAMLAIENISSIEKDNVYKTDTYKTGAKTRLLAYLGALEPHDYNKVYDIAINVIAGCGYFHTAYMDMLKVMHDVGENTPNISIKDANTIAFIDYLCSFIVTLVTAKKN